MTDATTHIKNARNQLDHARRHINDPDEFPVRVDELLGRVEGILSDLQPLVESAQDDD